MSDDKLRGWSEISYAEIAAFIKLYNRDKKVRRIIDKIIEDATRTGYTVVGTKKTKGGYFDKAWKATGSLKLIAWYLKPSLGLSSSISMSLSSTISG